MLLFVFKGTLHYMHVTLKVKTQARLFVSATRMYCALFRSVLSVCSICLTHALHCRHLILQCPCSLYMGRKSESLLRVTFISLSESPEVKHSFGLFQNGLCLGVTYLQFLVTLKSLLSFACSVTCGTCLMKFHVSECALKGRI